jgi:hypothetical protein
LGQELWHISVIAELGKQRQKGPKVKASLGYIEEFCIKSKNTHFFKLKKIKYLRRELKYAALEIKCKKGLLLARTR